MDVLINNIKTEKLIRTAFIDADGKNQIEKLPVKSDFYDGVKTYSLLDNDLNVVMKEEKRWNEKEEKFDRVKVPVIFTQNQINHMRTQNTLVNVYDEKTLNEHPTKRIAMLEAQLATKEVQLAAKK